MGSVHTGMALDMWPDGEFTPQKRERRVSIRSLMGSVSGLFVILTKIACLALMIESVDLLLPVGMQQVMDLAGDDHIN